MITASLATIPSRTEQLRNTVKSLLPQVDRLNVFLNNYKIVPEFLNHEKITLGFGDNSTGDAGKFYFGVNPGHNFFCDDDILYPGDYVAKMVETCDKYERKSVVGVHGLKFRFTPITDYHATTERFPFHYALEDDTLVHILGTGTIAFHSDTMRVFYGDFKERNMADIFFALKGQENKISFIAVKREKRWLIQQQVETSIFEENNISSEIIEKYINPIKWRRFDYFGMCTAEDQKEAFVEAIKNSHTHSWDILVPSLIKRKKFYDRMVRSLTRQIDSLGLLNEIKVRPWFDDGKLSIGYKSNQLIETSTARYVCRFDDDDTPADNYIIEIWEALKKEPDCVTFNGRVFFNGVNEQGFNAHFNNKEYKNENRIFKRPPCHLCPTKREIAVFYKFKELDKSRDRGSDCMRTMEMVKAGAIRTAIHIDKPLYIYNRKI